MFWLAVLQTPVLSSCVSLWFSLLAAAPSYAQTDPDQATQERLRVELREMLAADKRVRHMAAFGTFSPCEADSIAASLSGLEVEDYIPRYQALKAEGRLSAAEREVLLAMQVRTDESNVARLREIVAEYGWPDSSRIGGEGNPFIFLLHTPPDTLDAMLPILLRETEAGRMPPTDYARAADKQRKIRGQLQLYGTGDEFDPTTGTIGPSRVASIEETNAARRAIGLPPLDEYKEVQDE